MIHDKSEGVKDILDFHSGKMKQGLGINDDVVDQYLRFKESEFNVIAGLSNVGKTYWITLGKITILFSSLEKESKKISNHLSKEKKKGISLQKCQALEKQ